MRLVRLALYGRSPALFVAVAIMLCCQIEAQNPKSKVKLKAEPSRSTPEPLAAKPDLSKEFMVLGRKAFGAIDRLNEHLLDTKDLISHGTIMELSGEKESWVLRATTAEKASDDLQAVAESAVEKLVAQIVSNAVSDIQRNHDMVDTETEIAIHNANVDEIQVEQEGLQGPFLAENMALDIERVKIANRSAMDRATSATKELLSGPCYLVAKEAVSTGVFGACDSTSAGNSEAVPKELRLLREVPLPAEEQHQPLTRESPQSGLPESAPSIPGTSQPSPEERFAKLLHIDGGSVRAEDHTLIYTMEPPNNSSADEFAARFKKIMAVASRNNLRSFGFVRIRLETGGKTFEWPIK